MIFGYFRSISTNLRVFHHETRLAASMFGMTDIDAEMFKSSIVLKFDHDRCASRLCPCQSMRSCVISRSVAKRQISVCKIAVPCFFTLSICSCPWLGSRKMKASSVKQTPQLRYILQFFVIVIIIALSPHVSSASLPLHQQISSRNITTFFSIPPGIHCYIPGPLAPRAGPNLRTCQANFAYMLALPGADQPLLYRKTKRKPVIISKPPCAIALDQPGLWAEIYISRRDIVTSAWKVLTDCQLWGLGGWEVLEWRRDWILTVEGE